MRKSENHTSRSKSATKHQQKDTFPIMSDAAEQRWHMIAEAAYFVAERRGFDGGDPVQDWLAAEAEIDTLYYSRPASGEEVSAYAHLRDEVGKALSQIKDVIDAAAVKGAFERGLNEVKRVEKYSAEVLRKVSTTLRQDMERATERMGPGWEDFSEHSADLFSVWKDRSGSFLRRSAEAVRDWLHHERRGSGH